MVENGAAQVNALLLDECYRLACRFADSEESRVIVEERLKRLAALGTSLNESSSVSSPSSQMQAASEILHALATEHQGEGLGERFGLSHRVSSLSDPGEKEYILALVALRNGMDMQHRLEAHRHISAALSYSQNDPRYRAVADILRQGG